jgi:50S ribosomal subunit-associated GTPase HflX
MEVNATTAAAIRKFAIQTAHAFVLVYSLDNQESLRYVRKVRDEIDQIKGKGMPIIVVGNKADACKRKFDIPFKQKDEFSKDGVSHIKVSFKNRLHTNDIYKILFQHQTLQKFTNIVSKINRSQIFSDLRKLSLKADALEESVSRCFAGSVSKCNIKENIESPFILRKLKSFFTGSK